MTMFIIGHSEDNELILGQLLDCMHECFDRIFRKGIERKSLIDNMSGVILIVDEILDQGVIMHLDSSTIIARINTKSKSGQSAAPGQSSAEGSSSSAAQSSSSGSGLFASVFSQARSSLAKSMGMH